MPIVGHQSMTLADWGKRLDPNNQIAKVIEILNQTNEVLNDAMFLEANNITTHRTVIRTGLPESYWRLLNRGVPRSKSTTEQIDDRIGMLETWSVVDKDLAELNGLKAEFMLSEERAFTEAMNQKVANSIFYGNISQTPAAFHGLGARYTTLDKSKADSAANVVDAGGTGTKCTSAWLCVWGDQTLHMLFPKGSTAGLHREFLGKIPVVDDQALEYMGYKTHYQWKVGLTLRDWRYVVRVANIDAQQLGALVQGGAASAASQSLVRSMIKAHNCIPNIRMGRAAWYMNRTVKTMLDIMAAEKSNVNLTVKNFEGEEVTSFKGVPIRQCDALHNDEQAIV